MTIGELKAEVTCLARRASREAVTTDERRASDVLVKAADEICEMGGATPTIFCEHKGTIHVKGSIGFD